MLKRQFIILFALICTFPVFASVDNHEGSHPTFFSTLQRLSSGFSAEDYNQLIKSYSAEKISSQMYISLCEIALEQGLINEAIDVAGEAQLNISLTIKENNQLRLCLGRAFIHQARYSDALNLMATIDADPKDSSDTQATDLTQIIEARLLSAEIWILFGRPDNALNLLVEFYSEVLQSQNDSQLKRYYNGMAGAYLALNEPEKAAEWYEKAASFEQVLNHKQGQMDAELNLAKAYIQANQIQKAEKALMVQGKLAKELENKAGFFHNFLLRTQISVTQKNYLEANEWLNKAKNYFNAVNDSSIEVEILLLQAEIKRNTGDFLHAQQCVDKIERLFRQFPQLDNFRNRVLLLEEKSALAAAEGEFQHAYEFSQQYIQQYQRWRSEDTEQRLFRLRHQFEIERTEFENQLLTESNRNQELQLETVRKQERLYLGLSMGLVLIIALISGLFIRLNHTHRKLRQMAVTDALTKLGNRYSLLNRAEEFIRAAQLIEQPMCVALLDVDLFKSVNDRFGHQSGDEVLKQMAHICLKMKTEHDLVVRWGGEEFLLIYEQCNLQQALEKTEFLREEIYQHHWQGLPVGIRITASFGVTEWRENEALLEPAFARADAALYLAKQSGRNCVMTVDDSSTTIE